MIFLPFLGIIPYFFFSAALLCFCVLNVSNLTTIVVLLAPILCALIALETIFASVELKIPAARDLAISLATLVALDRIFSHSFPLHSSSTHISLAMLNLLMRSTTAAASISLAILTPVVSAELLTRWCIGERSDDLHTLIRGARILAVIFVAMLGMEFIVDAFSRLSESPL